MEKLLNELRNNLKISFNNIGDVESEKILNEYEDSLFLSITYCGLNWQKKKIEALFENGSVLGLNIESDHLINTLYQVCQ